MNPTAITYGTDPHADRAIREKALGTAGGAAAAVVVAIIGPPSWVLTALAILALLLAVMQRATYWRMYGLYTFLSCSTSLPQAMWRSKQRNAGLPSARIVTGATTPGAVGIRREW